MKIVILGAGHGGLVAGSKLAKEGMDVTIYERKQESELGHDWEDRFTLNLLCEITEEKDLPKGSWRYRGDCTFVSPSKNTNIDIKYTDETRQKIMWRKPLVQALIEYATKCGVKIEYGVEIISPIIKGDVVLGINSSKGEIKADLIIDSLGVLSPIRCSLPDNF